MREVRHSKVPRPHGNSVTIQFPGIETPWDVSMNPTSSSGLPKIPGKIWEGGRDRSDDVSQQQFSTWKIESPCHHKNFSLRSVSFHSSSLSTEIFVTDSIRSSNVFLSSIHSWLLQDVLCRIHELEC